MSILQFQHEYIHKSKRKKQTENRVCAFFFALLTSFILLIELKFFIHPSLTWRDFDGSKPSTWTSHSLLQPAHLQQLVALALADCFSDLWKKQDSIFRVEQYTVNINVHITNKGTVATVSSSACASEVGVGAASHLGW